MSKIIKKFDSELVRSAVNRIAEPVIQTITPLGNNVLFEKDLHSVVTNDGVTIAKMIDSEDEVEDSIIQMVKYGALSTNREAGDGTSTTILLTKKLVDMGTAMIDSGEKPMRVKKKFEDMKEFILGNSEQHKRTTEDKRLIDIARVSSNNDTEIAENVVSIIDTAGLDGMVFLEESKNGKTKITKDTGYGIDNSMFDPVLGNKSPGVADYKEPYVFITDKKLYHIEECKEILEKAYSAGAKCLTIVAKGFVGESANFLIGNHMDEKVPMDILLIQYEGTDKDTTPIHDLAMYLGTKVVTEKTGSLKGKLNDSHFKQAQRVYSAGPRTIFVTSDKSNPELSFLIEEVKKKKEEDKEDENNNRRLASLTTGSVTLYVGAATGPELREKIFRYEDAINATRSALRSGYVLGGGLTLYACTREGDAEVRDFGETSVRQIAQNTGIKFVPDMYSETQGYHAKKEEYLNLEEEGVIEPYDVFYHSVVNAFSVATSILTSGYFIVNKNNDDD